MITNTISSIVIFCILNWNNVEGSNRSIRQTPCGGMYECTSGECIQPHDVCNGINQCSDGSDEFPSTCGCGEKTELARTSINVPGVRNVHQGGHPWHVGIYRERIHSHYTLLCSGALIYSDIVLTSAHSLIEPDTQLPYLTSALFVSLGKLKKDFSVDEKHQQKFKVREVVILDHYEGDFKGYQRNLAIVKLTRSIIRTHYVKPVCLWTGKNLPPGISRGALVGWGLQLSGSYAINLRETSAAVLDIRTCSMRYLDHLHKPYLTRDKFCLTFDQEIGLREEDAGGPVTFYDEGRTYLIGIISKQVGTKYGLATLTSKHIKWIQNTTYHLKQVDHCLRSSHFNCITDGTCISVTKICDGKRDCQDGSDEDTKVCGTSIDTTPNESLGKKCLIPERKEIINVLRCGQSSGCTNLYSAPSNSRYQITCPEGYGFATPNTKAVTIVCADGEWIPSIEQNKCLPLCKLDGYKSLSLTCKYLGSEVSCYELLKPDTVIEVSCRKQYQKVPLVNYVNETRCRKDGIINNELSPCVPICGLPFDNSDSQTLISKGEELAYAKYPWHVAMYWKEEVDDILHYLYKCGGTLLDSNKVLTAAHCVWKATNHRPVEASVLAVALGKLRSAWLLKDPGDERADVSSVIIGEHYDGAKTKHSNDIAILVLSRDVKLSNHIMPACLDLDGSSGGIPKDQSGHIVGWGSLSGEEPQPSHILMETYMGYLDLDDCRKKFDKFGFIEYLHPDKFCALYTNGSGTQVGDSGGGMTFTHDSHHYVYGIVSVKKAGQDVFAVFTSVQAHGAWLKKILNTK